MLISTCSTCLNRGPKIGNDHIIVKFASEVGVFFCNNWKKLCRFDNFGGVEFLHHSYQNRRRRYINYIKIIAKQWPTPIELSLPANVVLRHTIAYSKGKIWWHSLFLFFSWSKKFLGRASLMELGRWRVGQSTPTHPGFIRIVMTTD